MSLYFAPAWKGFKTSNVTVTYEVTTTISQDYCLVS